MKKILSITLIVVILLTVTGCNLFAPPTYVQDEDAETITVSVSFINTENEDEVLFEKDIAVKANEPTAIMATYQGCKEGELTYAEADGFFTDIAGLPTGDTVGWILYINGETAQLGAAEQVIADGDVVEWKFIDYTIAFG